ncbi:MAG: patatin-like phospholipase family protein [Sedimentisphaerales bacterium]|nr:patatin-like phospholipase family protein [Sedimentisphaerales bacterium]
MKRIAFFRLITVVALPLVIWGCAGSRNPVPLDKMDQAQVVDMSDIRMWEVQYKMNLIPESLVSSDCSFLALSGGGANGAFGAGFLTGWSQSGTRPTFRIVTGISTGALIAQSIRTSWKIDLDDCLG